MRLPKFVVWAFLLSSYAVGTVLIGADRFNSRRQHKGIAAERASKTDWLTAKHNVSS